MRVTLTEELKRFASDLRQAGRREDARIVWGAINAIERMQASIDDAMNVLRRDRNQEISERNES